MQAIQNPKSKIQNSDAPFWYALVGFSLATSLVLIGAMTAPRRFPATPFRPETILDKPVPDFRLPILNGAADATARVSLFSLHGKKPVALYFLSGQCGMCRMINPRVVRLIQSAAGQGVAFFGVRCNAPDKPAELRAWADANHLDIPILNDERGMASAYFQVAQTPTFAILDAQGRLRYLGAFDDNLQESNVKRRFVADALAAIQGRAARPREIASRIGLRHRVAERRSLTIWVLGIG